jgi:site-specific recombinase XerD
MASLVDFLAREAGMVCRNPFRAVKKVTLTRGAPRALTQNEWNGVRRAAAAWEEKDGGLALAVVSLLRHAGLRAGELAALRADDVELGTNSGQVRIRQGKGLMARTVPLNTEAREGIASWKAARASVLSNLRVRLAHHGAPLPPWADDTQGAFLVGQRGPFTRRGLGMITEKLGERAGLLSPLSPHQLRHTFATAALDPAGYGLERPPVPLAALQRLMGHACVETTAVYTRFSDGNLARLLEEEEW